MAGQQEHTLHDTAIGWAILITIAAVILFIFWYFYEPQCRSAYRWVKWGQIKANYLVISTIYDTLNLGEEYTVKWEDPATGRITEVPYDTAMDMIARYDVADLHDNRIMDFISTVAMQPLKMPLTVIMGLVALWIIMAGPGTQYRRKMGLDGLIGVQSRIFPVISPFVKFNPSSMPPRPPGSPVPAKLPLFAEALGPEEWLAYNEIPIPDGQVDSHAAFIAFARQLGAPWRGPMKLAPHRQVLLAAFCLKASRKRKEADDMLGRLASCWSHTNGLQLKKDGKLLNAARKVLRNSTLAGKTLTQCNQHAFQTTAMLRGLETARQEGGVMAAAQFVWLRGYDRTLWYPLNNLGRQSYHMEALGAMTHYKSEKRVQRPIPKPKVGDAIESISEYISSSRARPIPQLDYSGIDRGGVKKPKAGVKKAKKRA